jgi:hypothetical protein
MAVLEKSRGNWPLPAMSPIFFHLIRLPDHFVQSNGHALSGHASGGGFDESDKGFDFRHHFHFGVHAFMASFRVNP